MIGVVVFEKLPVFVMMPAEFIFEFFDLPVHGGYFSGNFGFMSGTGLANALL